MSILNYAADLAAALHLLDAIHQADAQLHAAHKGETVNLDLPANLPRIKTASGRRVHVPFIPLTMDDDPRPPHAPKP